MKETFCTYQIKLKKIWFLILIFIISACAKPNYIEPRNTEDLNNQKLESECRLKYNFNELCLNWSFINNPESFVENAAEIKVELFYYNENTLEKNFVSLPEGYTFNLEPWMNSMGHDTSPVSVTLVSPGVYQITEVWLYMAGPWDLYFRIYDKNKNQVDELHEVYRVIK